jgi:hypothetical protein
VFVRNALELAGETFARAEWVALFLLVVGGYWASLGFSGIRQGHTRGFGWRVDELFDEDAQRGGVIWSLVGVVLLFSGILVWVLKA